MKDYLDALIEEAKNRGCVIIKLKNYNAIVTAEDLEELKEGV